LATTVSAISVGGAQGSQTALDFDSLADASGIGSSNFWTRNYQTSGGDWLTLGLKASSYDDNMLANGGDPRSGRLIVILHGDENMGMKGSAASPIFPSVEVARGIARSSRRRPPSSVVGQHGPFSLQEYRIFGQWMAWWRTIKIIDICLGNDKHLYYILCFG
jgi:hypothetical protein